MTVLMAVTNSGTTMVLRSWVIFRAVRQKMGGLLEKTHKQKPSVGSHESNGLGYSTHKAVGHTAST